VHSLDRNESTALRKRRRSGNDHATREIQLLEFEPDLPMPGDTHFNGWIAPSISGTAPNGSVPSLTRVGENIEIEASLKTSLLFNALYRRKQDARDASGISGGPSNRTAKRLLLL
jgi:hypothetical protein